MVSIPIIWLPVLFLVLAGLAYFTFHRLQGQPQLTIVEVTQFLRPTHSDEFLKELNPLLDEVLQSTFSRRKFLESQRNRLHRMKEHLSCMTHDAFILLRLASTEVWRETKYMPGMENSERYIELGEQLHRAAVEFACVTTLSLMRVNFWLIFRTQWWIPLPAPRIWKLSVTGGLRFHASYRKFKEAAGALCLEYGQEFYDEIMPMI